jgi:hypothetical protein
MKFPGRRHPAGIWNRGPALPGDQLPGCFSVPGDDSFFMNKIPVALFNHRAEAEPLQRRLRDHGVPAEVRDCTLMSGVHLDVPADRFEQAYGMAMDWDAADGACGQAIHCPECGSLRVEYPQYSRKSILPNLLVGFLAAIGAADKEFYCQDCHFTWPKEGTPPARLRPHSAPNYFIEGIEQTPGGRT